MRTLKNIIVGIGWFVVLIGSAASEEVEIAPRERTTRTPSVDAADMLERFVDELVPVSPGHDQFPKSLKVGDNVLAPEASFRIAAYETTQELYRLVNRTNPSRWRGARNVTEMMTYGEAETFCVRLTELLRAEQLIRNTDRVRLPTDVEWEYACRAGSVDIYCFGSRTDAEDLLDQYAWHTGNAAGNDPSVGELKPNRYGMYDVHGYLWEFVDGRHGSTADSPDSDVGNVAMGGSWKDNMTRLACDSRISVPEDGRSDAIGFRCVVSEVESGPGNTAGE